MICLHKESFYCVPCREVHDDHRVEVTTYGSPGHEYLCQLCSGIIIVPWPDHRFSWERHLARERQQ